MLVYASNEVNSENTDGTCTVLYFDNPADKQEVQEGLRHIQKNPSHFRDVVLVADPDDNFFSYKERATPLSTKAGLFRYECCGSC